MNMIEVVRDVKKGRTERRIQITGNDEIGELAGSNNQKKKSTPPCT